MTATTLPRPKRTDGRYCASPCGVCEACFMEDVARWEADAQRLRVDAAIAFDTAREMAERAGTVFTFLGKTTEYWRRLDKLVRTERPDLARKAETPPREYLFLGGPVHGQRIATEFGTYRVPVPTPPVVKGREYYEPLKAATYRRRLVDIADRVETVYTYEGTN